MFDDDFLPPHDLLDAEVELLRENFDGDEVDEALLRRRQYLASEQAEQDAAMGAHFDQFGRLFLAPHPDFVAEQSASRAARGGILADDPAGNLSAGAEPKTWSAQLPSAGNRANVDSGS